MEYRKLGRTGIDVSAVSLGTEYLIDLPLEHVAGVIHEAVDRGVNYFDLFYAQARFRDVLGAAFEGRRDKVLLTAHLGAAETDGQSDKTREPKLAEKFFEDYLRRFRTDYVDVLFLHNCDSESDYESVMREGGLADLAERLVQEGKARFVGFSGHTISTSRKAIESGRVEVLMFPVNLAGHAVEGKSEMLRAAAERGVAVVAMKPYAGGKLLQEGGSLEVDNWLAGEASRKLVKPSPVTPVTCLSYVLSRPGVACVVPGCKDTDELSAALFYLDASDEERDFSHVVSAFDHYVEGECVYCNHCLPCPSGIDIGATIRLLETVGDSPDAAARAAYEALSAKASTCIECGDCEDRCPFGVSVIPRMKAALRLFE